MDLDAPENPTPEEWEVYVRYKRWRDRITPDTRPRLSQRAFINYVQRPLSVAGLACMWWGMAWGQPVRPFRPELDLLGMTLGLLPLLVRKVCRIRPAPDA
jgi:hypothetical protein